mmetsp:Transcript_26115/g.46443  ORF Transcript_26115/g.46443 Transcript_26115/m.46443 type:complete len:204 (+) Transcript_26115:135-746(+)
MLQTAGQTSVSRKFVRQCIGSQKSAQRCAFKLLYIPVTRSIHEVTAEENPGVGADGLRQRDEGVTGEGIPPAVQVWPPCWRAVKGLFGNQPAAHQLGPKFTQQLAHHVALLLRTARCRSSDTSGGAGRPINVRHPRRVLVRGVQNHRHRVAARNATDHHLPQHRVALKLGHAPGQGSPLVRRGPLECHHNRRNRLGGHSGDRL